MYKKSLNENARVQNSWHIPSDMHGLRADQYLQRKIGRISRTRAQNIIFAKDFLLDHQAIKPSLRVKAGQQASLFRFAPDKKEDIEHFNISIIFEDDNILVLDKPYGLNIHPTANSLYKTLTFWLKKNYPNNKINPCHRIDKETSGLVVCAKNKPTESKIKKAFLSSQVNKSYLAVVEGGPIKSQAINLPLALQKNRGLVAIRMIHDKEGKKACTKIKSIKYNEASNRSLILCKPKTGRQHQIRAHLSLIGHPIVGDKLYAAGDEYFDAYCNQNQEILAKKPLAHFRHALHAYRLKFELKGQLFCFKSAVPEDFFLV